MTGSAASATQAAAAFAAIPLLTAVPPHVRAEIWRRSQPRRGSKGDTLFVQGDPTDHLVLLLDGEVVGTVVTPDGRCVSVAHWTGPGALDKVAVLGAERHSCTARVVRACTWRRLSRADLHELVDDVPAVRRHAIRVLAATAAAERDTRVQTATLPSAKRLAAHLSAEVARTGTSRVSATQCQLAEALGVSRATVNRQLALLARDGIVRTGRGIVQVLAVEHLAASRHT